MGSLTSGASAPRLGGVQRISVVHFEIVADVEQRPKSIERYRLQGQLDLEFLRPGIEAMQHEAPRKALLRLVSPPPPRTRLSFAGRVATASVTSD
jgi:hypothetical protein